MKTNWQLRMALGVLALLLATPTAWAQRHIGRKLTTPHADQTVATQSTTSTAIEKAEVSAYDSPVVAQAITAAKAHGGWRAAVIPARQSDFVFAATLQESGASLVPTHLSFVSEVAIRSEGSPLLLTVLDPATGR